MAERQRAKTDSAIVGAGTPMSSALTEVHLPVPFWPAVSRTMSTKAFFLFGILLLEDVGGDFDEEAVERAGLFHSEKISPISAGLRPRRP